MALLVIIALLAIIGVLFYLLIRKPDKKPKYERPEEPKQIQAVNNEIEVVDFSNGIQQLPGMKLEFADEPKGIKISNNEYIQALDPKAIAPLALAASGKKFAIITSEVSGAIFMKYANGFSGTPMFDKAGKLVGHGSFELISRTAVLATTAYGLASYVFACAHLKAINSKLTEIKNQLDCIKDMLLDEHLAVIMAGLELQNDLDFWRSPNLIEYHFYDLLKEVNWWFLHVEKEFERLKASKKKEEDNIEEVFKNIEVFFLANKLMANISTYYFGNNKSKTNNVRELVTKFQSFIEEKRDEISKLKITEKVRNLFAKIGITKEIETSELPDILINKSKELINSLETIEVQKTFYIELPKTDNARGQLIAM